MKKNYFTLFVLLLIVGVNQLLAHYEAFSVLHIIAGDIEVAYEGNTLVEEHTSSGNASELEKFKFQTLTARYIKYEDLGNSQTGSDWNSLTEFKVNNSLDESIDITDVILINADTGNELFSLLENTQIDLAKLPTSNLDIRIEAGSAVGSIQTILRTFPKGRYEHIYNNQSAILVKDFLDGNWFPNPRYILDISTYVEEDAKGDFGDYKTLSISIIDSRENLAVLDFVFGDNHTVNQDFGIPNDVGFLEDGYSCPDVSGISDFDHIGDMIIRLNTTSTVKSVKVELVDYPLFTPQIIGTHIAASLNRFPFYELTPGDYIIRATPFSEEGGEGISGEPYDVSFTITDSCKDVDVQVKVEAANCDGIGGKIVFTSNYARPNSISSDLDTYLWIKNDSNDYVIESIPSGNYSFRYHGDNGPQLCSKTVDIVVDYDCVSSDFTFRVNTGGTETEYNEETFITDNYFDTGNTLDRPQTGLPEPYQSFRYSPSKQMNYDIPVPDGEYTVNLYFAELWFGATGGGSGGVGSRIFDVNIEGALIEDNLDVFAEVGADAMLMKNHVVTVTDGILNIAFDSRDEVGGKRHPIINAIEVISNSDGDSVPPMVTSITTEDITENSFKVDWMLNEASTGKVLWGTSDAALDNETTFEPNFLTHHIQTVSGLNANTTYYYSVVGEDEAGNSFVGEIQTVKTLEDITAQRPFIFSVKRNEGLGLEPISSVRIPIDPNLTYNYTVDWGDGYIDENVTTEITHDYGESVTQTYKIKITGIFPRPYFGVDREYRHYRFIELYQWGDIEWISLEQAFEITHLEYSALDVPDLSECSSLKNMFKNSLMTGEGSHSLSNWEVGAITDMSGMFEGTIFNQNISSWDVGNVTNMSNMFAGSVKFHDNNSQFIASHFNKDISNWDVSNVTNMSGMFSFDGAFSNENYDDTLTGWSQLPSLQNGVTLDSSSKYCKSEVARQYIIDTYGWIITDGGKAADCEEPNDFVLRINTGGTEIDYNGETFITDTYFNTGNTLDRPQTGLPEPYQSFRYSPSQQMSYNIPIPDGEYTVNLYFAELWFGATGGGSGGVGSRVFDVNIEGVLAEDNLDIFAEVGADAMLMKTHTVTVTGGVLNIDFDSSNAVGGERHPVINAIEVLSINNQTNNNQFFAAKGVGADIIGLNNVEMQLLPNPAQEHTTVSFSSAITIDAITIFDIHGRLIQTISGNHAPQGNSYDVNVSTLQPGLYIIKALDVEGVSYEKQLIVK